MALIVFVLMVMLSQLDVTALTIVVAYLFLNREKYCLKKLISLQFQLLREQNSYYLLAILISHLYGCNKA